MGNVYPWNILILNQFDVIAFYIEFRSLLNLQNLIQPKCFNKYLLQEISRLNLFLEIKRKKFQIHERSNLFSSLELFVFKLKYFEGLKCKRRKHFQIKIFLGLKRKKNKNGFTFARFWGRGFNFQASQASLPKYITRTETKKKKTKFFLFRPHQFGLNSFSCFNSCGSIMFFLTFLKQN